MPKAQANKFKICNLNKKSIGENMKIKWLYNRLLENIVNFYYKNTGFYCLKFKKKIKMPIENMYIEDINTYSCKL